MKPPLRTRSRFFGLLCSALLLPVAAAAAEEATASGRWIVDGKTYELGHARVFREADPFGRGTNPCVLVSSAPVPDAAVPADDEGIAELLGLMRAGKLVALQICFDATGRKLRDVNDVFAFHSGVSPGRFGFQGFHRFAPDPAAKDRIAGRLTGAGDTNDGGKWTDEIVLSAPIPQEK